MAQTTEELYAKWRRNAYNHFWSEQRLKWLQAFKLTARSHFTETTVISIPFPLPLVIINLSSLGRRKQAARNFYSFLAREKSTYYTQASLYPWVRFAAACIISCPCRWFTLFFFKNKLSTLWSKKDTCTYTGRHKYFSWQSRRTQAQVISYCIN